MLRRGLRLTLLAVLLVIPIATGAWPLRSGSLIGSGGGGTQLALVRTLNNPSTTSATPDPAFWILGQPFVSDPSATPDVPPGDAVTATLGGTPVRAQFCERKLDAAGNLAWAQTIVDFSNVPIAANGGSANLVFTSAPGSWIYDTGGNRTDADWEGLHDTIVISNVTTTSASGADMNSGPYTATFDGGSTNTIKVLCNGAVTREVQVVAKFVNSGSTAQCYLQAVADYAVMQKSDGTLGPIASEFNIENFQLLKTGCTGAPGVFTADLAWYRNGTLMRSYNDVSIPAETGATLMRPMDAEWDWSADDPGIWVGQDYTVLAKTLKSLPFVAGLSYVGGNLGNGTNTAVTAYSGGVFTFGNHPVLYPTVDAAGAVAIAFEGSLGGLSGLSLDTVYWLNTAHDTLYDTEADAFAGGTTGQILPTGTYTSGLDAVSAFAPENIGPYDSSQPDTGSRPELGIQSEWVAAYVVGNTQNWQNAGRVAAFDLLSNPIYVISSATGTLPMLVPISGTTNLPNLGGGAGMGSALSSLYTAGVAYSSDINGGAGPTGGTGVSAQTGLWSYSREHPPSPGFLVWLLEGNPYLQRMIVLQGDHAYADYQPANREYSYSGVGGGQTYDGSITTCCGLNDRAVGWAVKDLAFAEFASMTGSAEEKYYQTAMENEANFEIAYQAYKGANFQQWGAVDIDDDTASGSPAISDEEPYLSNFMTSYNNLGWAVAALLVGDFDPSVDTVANNVAQLQLAELNVNCPFFADNYNPVIATVQTGETPTPPAGYVSAASEIGVGEEWTFSFSGTTVTVSGESSASPGWGTSYNTEVLPFAAGDIYRPFSYNSDGAAEATPPSQLTIGQDYYVCNPSGATFQLSATKGDCSSPISFSTVSNAGGIMAPAGQATCPPASDGTMHSNIASPDSYLNMMRAGMCLQAERGVTGAAAACTTAEGLTTANFNTEAMWALQGSP